jgi:hypothetical protein
MPSLLRAGTRTYAPERCEAPEREASSLYGGVPLPVVT